VLSKRFCKGFHMDALRFRLRVFLALFLVIMILGTLGFMHTEGFSLLDSLYFSIVTVATVGYGDIHPVSQGGKFLAILLIICGVGTFLGVVANATEIFLERREKHLRMQKVHMVMGLFFGEAGTRLLNFFAAFDPRLDTIREKLLVTGDWSEDQFVQVSKEVKGYRYSVDIQRGDLEGLRSFLAGRSDFLIRLLEHPVLLEHESFTELLRAVFHLREELLSRGDLSRLPESDYAHLAGDIRRAYTFLVHQWLNYMRYLKENYPYLFSLSMRTNPFDPGASAVIK